MKIKDDTVNIWGLQPQMRKVLREAEKVWAAHGEELVITSARDGMHSAGSLHYYGFAVDLRTRYFDDENKAQVAEELEAILGHPYDVVVHTSHIHVEYDS